MNKQEFLRQLERSLVMGKEEKNEVMRYYTEYFEEAGPENEQAVLEELGVPKVLAEKLNAECETERAGTEEAETQEQGPDGEDHAFNETIRELEEELRNLEQEVQETINEAEMELREAEIDVREAEIDVNEAKAEVDAARAEWEAAKKDVEEAKRVVNAIMAELQQAVGEAAEKLEEELSEAEDELTEVEEAETEADDALRDAMDELRDAEQALKDAERELRSAQREAASVRREKERELHTAGIELDEMRSGRYRRTKETDRDINRNVEIIIDDALRSAERTTRTVFTSLKDIFGGGQADKEVYEFSDYDMEPFHTIRVDVENCPVTVALSENDRYGVDAKFALADQDEWEIHVADGTLIVKKCTSKRFKIQIGFSRNNGKNSEYVRIYLPKVAMDIVELISSNGSIQVADVSTQTLIAETSNAVIRVEDTKALSELKADTSNGRIMVNFTDVN